MDNCRKKEVERLIELARQTEFQVCIWGAGYIGKGIGLKLLKQLAIKVDYYCDNNETLIGKEIAEGIRCEGYDRLVKNCENTICFLIMRSDYIGEVFQQLTQMGISNIVTYQELLEMDRVIEQYYPFMSRNKIAIYTCIVGDYDQISEPLWIENDCDYYIISDRKPERETVFKYLDICDYLPDDVKDNTRKNRYIKINAHKIFPQYRYSIYVDGNIVIKKGITKCIENLPKSRIGVAGESYWDSVYIEGLRCIESKFDDKEFIMKQIEKYWLEGMPEHFGSFLCNVLAREHNHPNCVKLMEEWWEQLKRYSRRDQISFPYVLWKNGYTKEDIKQLAPKPGFLSDYWLFIHEHNQHRITSK